MKRKKREFQSSELVKSFAKIYSFEDKLLTFDIKDYLKTYLDESVFNEIKSVDLKENILIIKINSPLLRNDFQLRKSFFLRKLQEKFGLEKIQELQFF